MCENCKKYKGFNFCPECGTKLDPPTTKETPTVVVVYPRIEHYNPQYSKADGWCIESDGITTDTPDGDMMRKHVNRLARMDIDTFLRYARTAKGIEETVGYEEFASRELPKEISDITPHWLFMRGLCYRVGSKTFGEIELENWNGSTFKKDDTVAIYALYPQWKQLINIAANLHLQDAANEVSRQEDKLREKVEQYNALQEVFGSLV